MSPEFLEHTRASDAHPHTDGPWRHRKKDGTILFVEIAAHPIQFGDADACLVMAIDITERKRLEEELRQSQKLEAVGQLAGGIAHDFNNLLTVIEGYAEMIRADQAPEDVHRDSVEEILVAAQRAASLTRQLLAFSRRQILQPIRLNLNANVDQHAAHALPPAGREYPDSHGAGSGPVGRVRRSRADGPDRPEPRRQCPRCDGARRNPDHRDRQRRTRRRRCVGHPGPGRRRLRPPLRSATPDTAWTRRPCAISSSPSSPPRKWAAAPAWDSPRSTASSRRAEGTYGYRASRKKAARFRSTCLAPKDVAPAAAKGASGSMPAAAYRRNHPGGGGRCRPCAIWWCRC